MRTTALFAVLLAAALAGCMSERTYVDSNVLTETGSGMFGATASGFVRGDVGELEDFDSSARDMYLSRDERLIEFTGNVPHQSRGASSVYLDIVIANWERVPVGQELRQQGLADPWSAESGDEPALDVYVCPNGEGVSGNADDIVVTRTGGSSFNFRAISSNPEQNLDVDLDLTPN